ncbi:MAG: hypothetical protein JO336_14950 [Acidobacteriia bacterium]|nr:hypothetical protein [Terriglobia bacterium]
MFNVSLGEHSKLTANPAERDRVRKFYTHVLGYRATKESEKIDPFGSGPASPWVWCTTIPLSARRMG